jgi:hypothetical protein
MNVAEATKFGQLKNKNTCPTRGYHTCPDGPMFSGGLSPAVSSNSRDSLVLWCSGVQPVLSPQVLIALHL